MRQSVDVDQVTGGSSPEQGQRLVGGDLIDVEHIPKPQVDGLPYPGIPGDPDCDRPAVGQKMEATIGEKNSCGNDPRSSEG